MCKCSYIEKTRDILLGFFFDIYLLPRYLNYCWMHVHVRKCGRLQKNHKLTYKVGSVELLKLSTLQANKVMQGIQISIVYENLCWAQH